MNRRGFSKIVGGAALASSAQGADKEWAPSYVLSSAMYGNMPLEVVLEEVGKSGSASIDIWRKVHATHREQISKIGDEAFQKLLKKTMIKKGMMMMVTMIKTRTMILNRTMMDPNATH